MASYYLAAIGAVLLTAVSQVLMKLGARSPGSITWRIYLNPYTLIAYATLVLVTLLNLYALRQIPLKLALVFLPLILLLVLIFSFWLLGERLTWRQTIGAVVTLFGVVVFNL